MKLAEAYEVLGLKSDASEDDVKKRSRELMKKFHPDVNKDASAEAQFKKVNEATERIKLGTPDVQSTFSGVNNTATDPFAVYGDFSSIFETMFGRRPTSGNYRQQTSYVTTPKDVHISLALTFEEAVTGVQKTLKYTASTACRTCQGVGSLLEGNGCQTCGGRGVIVESQTSGNMHFTTTRTCTRCEGRTKMRACYDCKGKKASTLERTQQVNFPAGVKDGSILRVKGIGNAIVEPTPGRSTDVVLNIRVTPSKDGLTMKGDNVLYVMKIPLLDALKGKKVNVPTVYGEREIEIPPKTLNGDNVTIAGHGVGNKGNQVVSIAVEYPSDVSGIIDVLTKNV